MTDAPPAVYDNGETLYTVVLQFSNDYPKRDDEAQPESHPLNWDWRSLIDEPDVRVLSVYEETNLDYGVADAIRDLLAAGLIEHTGEYRNGRPVYVATVAGRVGVQA